MTILDTVQGPNENTETEKFIDKIDQQLNDLLLRETRTNSTDKVHFKIFLTSNIDSLNGPLNQQQGRVDGKIPLSSIPGPTGEEKRSNRTTHEYRQFVKGNPIKTTSVKTTIN